MKKALVVDTQNAHELSTVLSSPQVDVVCLKSRRTPQPILPQSLWTYRKFRRIGLGRMEAWLCANVERTEPDAVYTFTDNNLAFHLAAAHFPGVPFVAIQNGQRWPFANLGIPFNSKLRSTYLCLGDNDVDSLDFHNIQFKEVRAVGSLRSALNGTHSGEKQPLYDICLVSTWNPGGRDPFSRGFRKLTSWLSRYRKESGPLTIAIAGRSPAHSRAERLERRYVAVEHQSHWLWLSRQHPGEIYRWCDSSRLVIGAGSTVTREAIGRCVPSTSYLTEWTRPTSPQLENELYIDDYQGFAQTLDKILLNPSATKQSWDTRACASTGLQDITKMLRGYMGFA